MGAITFSLDPKLATTLQSVLPLNLLVETGTFKGDAVAELQLNFDKIISIELSKKLSMDASIRFEKYPHIQILQGNSKDILFEISEKLERSSVLFWLDAHWCVAPDSAGELSQCPLLDELKAIGRLNADSVVVIDDARLFLAPPLAPYEISQWPSFNQIVTQLLSMSSAHELMVVNDVIAFYPNSAKFVMESYAQNTGVDWLVATNCLKENGSFIQQLEEKENVIQEQASIIQEQLRVLHIYHRLFWPFRPALPVLRMLKRSIAVLRPKLGNLNQYQPRPLTIEPSVININHLTAMPKVSIVTPSFQQGGFIERTLLSVLEQDYPALEYFVQDGGSNDSTITVLKKYAGKLSGWVSIKDSGQSQAINRGFENTSGEIMGWLNSDDLLLPDTLITVVNFFNRHPEVEVVYGNRLLIDENDKEIGRWILPGHNSKVLSWVDYIPQETLFWRRRIWDKVGGQIDVSFSFAMDWDLLVRFRDAGAQFAHIPLFLGAFRIHEHQKTSASINVGHQEMDRIRERLFGRVPSRTEIRRTIFPFLIKHVLVDMIYRIKYRLWVQSKRQL